MSVVKRVEVSVGLIIAALITFVVIIITLLVLGTYWNLMQGIQFTVQGRTVFAIFTWGAFLLSCAMMLILIAAVDVNEMQKRHLSTVAAMKVAVIYIYFLL